MRMEDSSSGASRPIDNVNATTLAELEAPLLTTRAVEEENITVDSVASNSNTDPEIPSPDDVLMEDNDENDDDHSWQPEPSSTKQFCGRFVLGLLYVGISIYMGVLMIMGNVLDSSSGTGRGICHESSICILFVSWGMMCVFLGLNGLYVLCCKRRRSITNFLAPLAILIVYLLVAYAYMAIRNQIKYGGHGDDDDDDDGVFESSLSF